MSAIAFLQGAQAASELERTSRMFERRQRGLDALEQRYGPVANTPTEYGQLEGIDQRRQEFDRTMRQSAARNMASAFKQSLARTNDPAQAFARIRGVMTTGFGIAPEDVEQIGAALVRDPSLIDTLTQPQTLDPAERFKSTSQGLFDTQTQRWVEGGPMLAMQRERAETTAALQQARAAQIAERLELQRLGLDPENRAAIARATEGAKGLGKAEGERAAGQLPLTTSQLVELEDAVAAVEQNASVTRNAISELRGIRGVDLGPLGAGWGVTGVTGGILENVRGTDAAFKEELLQVLDAPAAMSSLQDLRKQAQAVGATGSGFGQITERELALLKAKFGALRNAPDMESFKRQLDDWQAEYERFVARALEGIRRIKASRTGAPAAATPGEALSFEEWERSLPGGAR